MVKILLLLLLAAAGCQPMEPIDVEPPKLPEPLLPLAKTHTITIDSLDAMARQTETYLPLPKGVADHMILAYIASGRDFFKAGGPDGYLLRVIPLDNQDAAVKAQTDVSIYLFRGAHQDCKGTETPLLSWHIPRGQLPPYWIRTRLLDSYLFRLSWQERDPGLGQFFFVVCLNSKFNEQPITLCSAITFEDDQLRKTDSVTPDTLQKTEIQNGD